MTNKDQRSYNNNVPNAPLAQLVEQVTLNHKVGGSTPLWRTTSKNTSFAFLSKKRFKINSWCKIPEKFSYLSFFCSKQTTSITAETRLLLLHKPILQYKLENKKINITLTFVKKYYIINMNMLFIAH